MEMQSGLSELSAISWVSAIEGCPLSEVPLYVVIALFFFAHMNLNIFSRHHNSLVYTERSKKKERSHSIDVSATCRSGTLAMISSKVNSPIAHRSSL